MAFLSDDLRDIGVPAQISTIFNSLPNQVAIQDIYFNHCRPITSLSVDGPIEISVPGQGIDYLDLRRSRLYIKAQILKGDGTELLPEDGTGLINMPLHAMFDNISTYANQQLISNNTNNNPYKSYFKMLMSNGRDNTLSQMTSQLFIYDDPDMDSTSGLTGSNGGLAQRYQYTARSKIFDLESVLLEDLFRIDKYLINGVDLHLKMYRSSSPFLFMSDSENPNYKLNILDCVFKACMIKVDSGVLINHAEILKTTTAKYPLTRTEVKLNTIPSGSGAFIWGNVWSNALPDKAYFAVTHQDAVNGSYTKNPYNFLNLASEVGLYVNGKCVNTRPLYIDVARNLHVTPLVELFETAEKWNKDQGLHIDRNRFGRGYAIYCFNIAPSDLGDHYTNLVHQGSARLEMKFESVTTTTLSCIAVGEFPALLEIDVNRDVKYMQ